MAVEEPPKPDKEVEVAEASVEVGSRCACGQRKKKREEDRVGRDIFDLGPLFLYL